MGYIVLGLSYDDPRKADRASAILALVGVFNIPIIYFSVYWWNTLHQGASISFTKAPTMATSMVLGIVLVTLSLWFYSMAIAFCRLKTEIIKREARAPWLRQLEEN